jgi:hypothetical protein
MDIIIQRPYINVHIWTKILKMYIENCPYMDVFTCLILIVRINPELRIIIKWPMCGDILLHKPVILSVWMNVSDPTPPHASVSRILCLSLVTLSST